MQIVSLVSEIMSRITKSEVPSGALSVVYLKQGAFVDCYYIDIPKKVSLSEYIMAFYTSPLFKVERMILSIATIRFALDGEALELSLGKSEKYSIWTVECRQFNQIILRDFTNKTRSWLMVQESSVGGADNTRLFFGSVVVPRKISESGQPIFGSLFHMFGRFHQVYSRALLRAAYKKVLRYDDAS